MDNVRILFCRCSQTDLLAPRTREAIASALGRTEGSVKPPAPPGDSRVSAAEVWIVDDLCALAERRDERLDSGRVCESSSTCTRNLRWASDADNTVVIACHERAVRALFDFAGCPLPRTARVVNVRGASAEEAMEKLGTVTILSRENMVTVPSLQRGQTLTEKLGSVPSLQEWPPWYPVIDSGRCVQCKKCLGFCLFGVYAMEGEKVRVANPRACKNNCPACARVCPQLAIIFPKCKESPINGAAISEQDLARKDLKVDVEAIARSGDLYAELRKRAANQEPGGHK